MILLVISAARRAGQSLPVIVVPGGLWRNARNPGARGRPTPVVATLPGVRVAAGVVIALLGVAMLAGNRTLTRKQLERRYSPADLAATRGRSARRVRRTERLGRASGLVIAGFCLYVGIGMAIG